MIGRMPMPSRYDLVDRIVPDGLKVYLDQARRRGDSYATIARNLYVDHDIEVTAETVRAWCAKPEAEATA